MGATANQSAYGDLKPQAWPSYEDGDFVVFEDVPLFDEHIGPDGTQYTPPILSAIAENMNRRVQTTGDFAPIVIGHTEDGEHKTDPPIVGLSGPYRMGTINTEQGPKACILGKWWFYKDALEQQPDLLKRYPRRSVEVWPEDRPENRYFDPIAILGSETPKRDLGLIYSKPRNGVTPHRYSMKYSAGTAAAANTFVPSFGKDRNSKGQESMPFAQEDFGQLIEALRPALQQLVQQAVDAALGGGDPIADVTPDADAGATTVQGDADAAPPPMAPSGAPPAGGPPSPDAGAPPVGPPGKPEKDMKGGAPQCYSELESQDDMTPGSAEKYRKQRNDARIAYRKLQGEHADLQQKYAKSQEELGHARTEQRRAQRYSKLADLRNEGYVFEVEEELDDTFQLDTPAFNRHCEKIKQCYMKAPIGATLPVDRDPRTFIDNEKAEQYAKAAAETVQKYRKKNVDLDYMRVLENVKKNKGVYREEAAA